MGDKPADPLGSTITSSGTGTPSPSGERRHRAGELIAHYRLGAPLGEGGMGVVYRASDEKLGRAVALKFLTRSDGAARARFMREARAASALDHPNIGTVYEVGEVDGEPFIAMALYEGETLRARIQRGKIPDSEIVAIGKQLCSALTAAHAAGIVHRDLKPANIMLLPDGTLKLLDFGLAKLTSVDESSLTRDGAILGTLAYMAPEQLKSGEIDARADLWALGAVLYELISGSPPFGVGPAATIVGRILTEDPAPLSGNLGAIALALLRKERADRLPSAVRVSELLASGSAPPLSMPRRQRRVLWISLASLSAFVMLVVFIANLQQQEAPKPPPPSNREIAAKLLSQYQSSGERSLLFEAAEAYRADGDFKQARMLYRSYIGVSPKPPQFDRALERIAELDKAQPTEPSPSPVSAEARWDELMERATREKDIGKYEEAARDFAAAYELKPNLDVLAETARAYELAHNDRLALFYWEELGRLGRGADQNRVVMIDDREKLDDRLATLRDRLGMSAPAEKKPLRLPATSKPTDAMRKVAFQHYSAAVAAYEKKDYETAAREFDATYEAIGDPTILFNAGQSFRNAKQYGHAIVAYGNYLRLAPKAKNRAEVEKRIVEMRDEVDSRRP